MSEEQTHSHNPTALPGTIGFLCMIAAIAIMVFPVAPEFIYLGLLAACFIMGLVAAYYGHRWRGAILTVGVLCLVPLAFSTCESGNRPYIYRWMEEQHVKAVAINEQSNLKWATWLLSEVGKGSAQVQFDLAQCYLKGRGVVKDEAKAREWLEKAAAQDHAEAKAALAKLQTPPNP